MGERRNYVTEKMRAADEVASRTSGVASSEEESAANKKAWKEAFDAQKHSEEVGAGRGKVNPPTVSKKKGGQVSASKRADGIAQRGKTRGKMI